MNDDDASDASSGSNRRAANAVIGRLARLHTPPAAQTRLRPAPAARRRQFQLPGIISGWARRDLKGIAVEVQKQIKEKKRDYVHCRLSHATVVVQLVVTRVCVTDNKTAARVKKRATTRAAVGKPQYRLDCRARRPPSGLVADKHLHNRPRRNARFLHVHVVVNEPTPAKHARRNFHECGWFGACKGRRGADC